MKREAKVKSLKKTVVLFLLVMFLCFVGGVALGAMSDFMADQVTVQRLMEQVMDVLRRIAPYGMAVLLLLTLAVCGVLYARAKKGYACWDGEDEAQIDRCEGWVSHGVLMTNVTLLLLMLAYSVCADTLFASVDLSIGLFWFSLVLFLLGIAICIVFQRAFVQLEKRMNPAMRGEVLDVHFQRDWDGSMDEAQRQIVGKASYKAFRTTNTTCTVLWIVGFLLNQTLHTGLLPIVFVLLLWLTSILSYSMEERRLEKGRS